MKYWILKSEPEDYSFEQLLKDGKACWDGVRNYQARNNIRAMNAGDLAIIYESVGPKAAVGNARIASAPYRDPSSKEDWSAVDIVPLQRFRKPLTLAQMKSDQVLKTISLVRQSRLSVCPVTEKEYRRILLLAGTA